jgi:hypothetical protein
VVEFEMLAGEPLKEIPCTDDKKLCNGTLILVVNQAKSSPPKVVKGDWDFIKDVPDDEIRFKRLKDGWWLFQNGDMFYEHDPDFVEDVLHGEPFMSGKSEKDEEGIEGIIIKFKKVK